MKIWRTLTKTEKGIVAVAIVLLLLVAFFVRRSDFGVSLRNRNLTHSIGAIEVQKRDVRIKTNAVFHWDEAQKGDPIIAGDSLFAGKDSSARVKMKDGQAVDVGENSLVHFVEESGGKIPNLKAGNFRLKVDGKLRIAMNGKVTNVRGRGSEIQVVVAENAQPRLKLLKGEAEVSVAAPAAPAATKQDFAPPVEVKQEQFISLRPGQESRMDLTDAVAIVEKPETPSELPETMKIVELPDSAPLPAPPVIEESEMIASASPPPALATAVPVIAAPVVVPVEIIYPERVVRSVWLLSELYSVRGSKVSKRAEPKRKPRQETYSWKGQPGVESYRVELASDAGFKTVTTSERTRKTQFLHDPANDEPIFWRICANGLCSQTGSVRFQTVFNDRMPASRFALKEHGPINWTRQAHDLSYLIESSATKDFAVSKLDLVSRPVFDPKLAPEQSLFVRVARVQDDMQLSEFSVAMEIKGKPEPKRPVKVQVTQAPPPQPARRPASVDTSLKVQIESLNQRTNERYRNSALLVQGASVFQRSSEQALRNEAMPNYLVAGIQMRKWYEDYGFEAGLRSQVYSVNAPGDEHQTLTLEARAMRRWTLPFRTFSFLKEIQLAPFVGAEVYSDKKTKRFSPAYELLNVGLKIDFPIFERWSTGGDIDAGYGFDKSQKFKFGGFLKFYLEAAFALGGGYRAHLFEAGSTHSAPAGVPYREAYGEGYVLFEWNY